MKTKWLMLFAVCLLPAGIAAPVYLSSFPSRTQEPTPRVEIEIWAGLSTPHREPKPSLEDRKRAEAKACLALNAYHEARGEGWAGQVAVGQVALRRGGG